MSDNVAVVVDDEQVHRSQELYYTALYGLRVNCEYIRLYRAHLSKWLTRIAIVRGVASSGGIGAWVIWRDYAFVWGSIIALSQVADALKDAIPYTARHKAANDLLNGLNALFIEALFEWEGVFAAQFPIEDIVDRRRKLMQRQHDLDIKCFPAGDLPFRADFQKLADDIAKDYLETMFGKGDPT